MSRYFKINGARHRWIGVGRGHINPITTLFGTLTTDPTHATAEYVAGERLAMVELSWRSAETASGVWDDVYLASKAADIATLQAAGFKITLGLGTHYVPTWYSPGPTGHFVDQLGNVSAAVDMVFSQTVRTKVEAYLAKVATVINMANIWAVRLTSGLRSEVLYPKENGVYSYWAYGPTVFGAAKGTDLATGQTVNPQQTWKAGASDTSISSADRTAFYDWYTQSLANTVTWLGTAVMSHGFAGWLQVVTPGSGIHTRALTTQINAGFQPNNIAAAGAAWDKIYAQVGHRERVMAHISSVVDFSGSDIGPKTTDIAVALTDTATDSWSSARWITRVANGNSFPVSGENPGYFAGDSNSTRYVNQGPGGMLDLVFQMLSTNMFTCFYWAHDPRLWDGTLPFYAWSAQIAKWLGGIAPIVPPNAPAP